MTGEKALNLDDVEIAVQGPSQGETKSKKNTKNKNKKSKKPEKSDDEKSKKEKHARELGKKRVNLGKHKLEYENKENYISKKAKEVIEKHRKEKELLKQLGMRIPIDTPSDKIKHIAEKSRARPIPLRVKPANHMLLERKVFTMTMPNKVKAEFEVFKAKGVLRRQSRVQKHESKRVRFGVAETKQVENQTAEWDDILIRDMNGCCSKCTIL